MHNYTPRTWYWKAEDGRIFSSADGMIVETSHEGWQAAEATDRYTFWPRDEAGVQSDDALQDVLTPYGIFVDLNRLKNALKSAIDAAAERERLKYITPGAGQAMTYARKVEEAKAVQVDDQPEAANYPLLAASLGIDGDDIMSVAAAILAMDAAWAQIGAAIEGARLAGKRAVDLAQNGAAALAATVTWPAPGAG